MADTIILEKDNQESKGKGNGAIAAGGVVLGAVGIGLLYEYSQYHQYVKAAGGPYVNSNGQSGFWAWLSAGAPTYGTTPPGTPPPGTPPPTANPQITVSPLIITYTTNALLGPTYSTSVITVTGTGFTPSSTATIYGNNNLNLGTATTDANGDLTGTIKLNGGIGGISASEVIASYSMISAADDTTGIKSQVVDITYQQQGGTTPPPTQNATISINPSSITASPIVTISGSGFGSLAQINVFLAFNGSNSYQQILQNIGTTIIGDLSIPNVSLPIIANLTSYSIYAADSTSGLVSNTLTIPVNFANNGQGTQNNPYPGTTNGVPNFNWQGTGYYNLNGQVINMPDQNTFNAYENELSATGTIPPGFIPNVSGTGGSAPTQPYQPGVVTVGSVQAPAFSWQGTGYYNLSGGLPGTGLYSPGGGIQLVSSQSVITNWNSAALILAQDAVNGLGTQPNPYPENANGTQTYRAPGWYSVQLIPAAGTTTNPTYVSNPAFITSYNQWVLAESPSPTPSPTPPPPSSGAQISVSPNPFSKSQNVLVVISGSGFNANSTITFTASGAVLATTVTASSTGAFSQGFGYPGSGTLDNQINSQVNGGFLTLTASDGTHTASINLTIEA